jgi:small subunit ribosomal protein S8
MSCTDPIADMLTSIRNGLLAAKDSVDVPHSQVKLGIAQVLKDEGYISRIDVLETKPAKTLRIGLKYGPGGEAVIHEVSRVSSPGYRRYSGAKGLKPIIRGMGISIISTSYGILSDRTCRKRKLGGEVICVVK